MKKVSLNQMLETQGGGTGATLCGAFIGYSVFTANVPLLIGSLLVCSALPAY